MNHLAHFALTNGEPLILVGSFLGDHIKGRVEPRFAGDIATGIRLHRAIDNFTDRHAIVLRSANRFRPPYRRYASIMTDIIFDHFLAIHWNRYYESSLADFSRQTLGTLLTHGEHLPSVALGSAQRMHKFNALAGYTTDEFVAQSFRHIGARLKRENPLHHAFKEVTPVKEALFEDFCEFYPRLMSFADDWMLHN